MFILYASLFSLFVRLGSLFAIFCWRCLNSPHYLRSLNIFLMFFWFSEVLKNANREILEKELLFNVHLLSALFTSSLLLIFGFIDIGIDFDSFMLFIALT